MKQASRSWERVERGNVGSQTLVVELVDPLRGESVLAASYVVVLGDRLG
jgi:hypothetical protein